MNDETGQCPFAVVASDDAILGGLIALNLRRRGWIVDQTDLSLPASAYWVPAFGRPRVMVINVERFGPGTGSVLQAIAAKSWVDGAAIVVAADGGSQVADLLKNHRLIAVTSSDDVRGVVTAVISIGPSPEVSPLSS